MHNGLLNIIIYLIQDKFIFHPERLSENYTFYIKEDFEEINLKANDGNILNGLFIKHKNPKGIIIYYHNHAGNLCNSIPLIDVYKNLNYSILMMDYRGYGKSTGKINEKLMLDDTELWYNFAKKNYDENHITVIGRGLGATFAAYVAAKHNPKQLILGSPFYNLNVVVKKHYPYLLTRVILKYKWDTARYLVNVRCKTYIFHGKKDDLVCYTNSERLYELSKENAELIIIPDGNHYNLRTNGPVVKRTKEILST